MSLNPDVSDECTAATVNAPPRPATSASDTPAPLSPTVDHCFPPSFLWPTAILGIQLALAP